MSRDAPVVIRSHSSRDSEHKRQRQHHTPHFRAGLPEQPYRERRRYWQAEDEPLIRTAVREEGQPDAEPDRVAWLAVPHDSNQRSEDKRAPNAGRCSTPITVRPVVENAEAH